MIASKQIMLFIDVGSPKGKKTIQQLLQTASKPHLANEQGDGNEQREREADDDGVIHRQGLRERRKEWQRA
jgi:hypothetical protein